MKNLLLSSVNKATVVKTAIGLLTAFFIALGFDFHTPAWHFKRLEAEALGLHHADSTLSSRIDLADSDRTDLRSYLKILLRAQCIDRPRNETILMGLDCKQLMGSQ
jgi:hypothetical protein